MSTKFGSSWNNGKAFAALIHHHRPDLVDMSKYESMDSMETLQDIFLMANSELGIPLLVDPEDIADVDRPDDRVIIPYVAFLFKLFAFPDLVKLFAFKSIAFLFKKSELKPATNSVLNFLFSNTLYFISTGISI